MTTAREVKFKTREDAMSFSEDCKEMWDLGYGIVYGPFLDDRYQEYWIVNEIVESGPSPAPVS